MRIKLLCCLMVFLLALPVAARPPKGDYTAPSVAIIDNTTFISANRILMFVTNHGNFGRDLGGTFGHDYGTWYPYPVGEDTSIINATELQNFSPNYAGGLWVGAIDSATGDIRIIISEYDSEYVPGPMENGTFMTDRGDFRVYKLYADSLGDNGNQTYDDYMLYGPDLGAPFWTEDTYDGEGNLIGEAGEPRILGDQFLWAVYNDADPNQHQNDAGTTAPLGLEVKQALFAYNRDDPLGDVVFMRYRIYNKGNNTLENCYFSLWCDPDLGTAGDDLVGCDTVLGLGFVYNADNDDGQYGDNPPPCWAYDFFQGPMVPGDENDTAIMWDFQKFPGMKNLGMTSFNKYINGTDPDNFNQTYWFMQGLTKTGSPYVYNGQVLTFVLSGDPIAGTGDLDFAPDDRRWMQTTGPITFRPGDSTEIVAASIAAQALDRKTSIALMKFYDRFAQLTYDSAFVVLKPPARPRVSSVVEAGVISLFWDDTSEVDPGTYPFEGYAIYQGETPAGPWHRVTNYDINNTIEDVFDEVFNPVTGVPEILLVQNGTNSDVQRHITITEDVITGLPLRDVTTYNYRVEAYCAFPEGPLGLRTLTSNATIRVTPQAPPVDVDYPEHIGNILAVTHPSGLSDGVVAPYVVNPRALTGDDYRIIFEDTIGIRIDTTIPDPINAPEETVFVSTDIAWHLDNVSTGQRLVEYYVDQTGGLDYPIVDGFKIVVSGPSTPGVKTSDMFATDDESLWGWDIPNGTRRFTWAQADFGFEGFRGALGWESPQHYFGGLDPQVPPSLLVNVLLRLATVDVDGNFDPADENVSYAYRYGRGFTAPAAQPEFVPFMINTVDGGYRFQDYERSCPLSAWNVDVDPPQRLALGYLENNAEFAVLDGKYWPQESDVLAEQGQTNVGSTGPREWLWIFLDDYTDATPNTDYMGEAIGDPMPIVYWAAWNRRGSDVPFATGDEFIILPAKINTSNDVFEFTAAAMVEDVAAENDLDLIKAVPNPFYLRGDYDPNPGSYAIKFHHLPEVATVRIYNLSGDLVRTIEKDGTDAIATWDVLNVNGLPVASGIYIYVVDAPGIGTKTGKMAVFVQQEVLDIY
ncbi:MAG: T9SS type A sorting domain-containing protein [Candidatus Zixiibacteriota bacterium]|nr:MAG: T9SS type A sorting domain-containing protein [candidate division Zixibacteria bacterium]